MFKKHYVGFACTTCSFDFVLVPALLILSTQLSSKTPHLVTYWHGIAAIPKMLNVYSVCALPVSIFHSRPPM